MRLRDLTNNFFQDIDVEKILPELTTYRHRIFGKNKVNIDWLASNLVGVHQIRFTDSDAEELFFVLDIDPNTFKDAVKHTKGINQDWKVTSNPFYIMIAILMHQTLTSSMSVAKQTEMLKELYYIISFKLITSIYSEYFKYPVDVNLAKQVFSRMSQKFLIKKLGSNFAVLNHKAGSIAPGTKNAKRLIKFKADDMIYVLSDISGSMRGFIKSYYQILIRVKESDEVTHTVSIHIDDDEAGRIVDITDSVQDYYHTAKRLLLNKESLISYDLLHLISDLLPGVDQTLVKQVLEELVAKTVNGNEYKDVILLIDNIFDATIEYLYKTDHYPPYDDSVETMIKYVKAYWSNSRVKNVKMLDAKLIVQNILEENFKITRHATIVNTSIVVCIYIFTRTVLDKKSMG